ncbi:MAG: type II secretion system protein [Verrucomicrobiales bacterium]
MKRHTTQRGFTLIELLVVITIIAILASIAVPVYNMITERAKKTKALAHAKQIALALKNYAIDEDGVYPTSDNSANEAFRELFNRNFNSETIFFVAGSAWTPQQPDNEVGDAPDYEQALEGGENHWAYVSGLVDSDKGNLPLVADGFSNQVGQYTDGRRDQGGVWKGEDAIIIRNDGSGAQEKLDADFRVMEDRGSGAPVDIFSAEYFDSDEPPDILNPDEPQNN